MIDEPDCHVQVAHEPPYRTTAAVPDSNTVLAQQHLPHAPADQQHAGFGDILMQTDYAPAGSNLGGSHGGQSLKVAGADSRNVLLAMNMNHPHSLTDPSIQETLSPFFQPFGVDVSHLPMTNPPIFQSSLTRYDDPVRRRRISISNGQISQLGEDLETVENLYNTQPPPLPQRLEHHPAKPFFEASAGHTTSAKNGLIQMSDNAEGGPPNALPIIPPWPSHNHVKEEETKSLASLLQDNQDHLDANASSTALPTSEMSRKTSTSSTSSVTASLYGSQGHFRHNRQDAMPGTNAWKRARLLERNRIAASKCRQRKKVAQMQLQQEFDIMSRENKLMKRKLDYYEKLVLKFKRFSEGHTKKCSDMQSFGIIEEMLMIDSGVREVDSDGLVVKIEEK